MDNIINSLLHFNIWVVAKVFVLIGLAVYCLFAFVVVRQVKLMTEVVSGMLGGILRFVSWIFFLFSIFVFVAILLFLR